MKTTVATLFIFFALCTGTFAQPVSFQWARTYGSSNGLLQRVVKVVTDSSGNVYYTGFVAVTSIDQNILTRKYSPSGNLIWSQTYDTLGKFEQATDMVVDRQGNVYVTGYGILNYTIYSDMLVIKYNSSGARQWVYRYRGNSSTYENTGRKLVLSADENSIYVAGESGNTGTGVGIATIKLNNNGQQQWISVFNGSGSTASDMAVDIKYKKTASGVERIAVTGTTNFNSSELDYVTLVYDEFGSIAYSRLYGYIPNQRDQSFGLLIDDSLSCYVTGVSMTTLGVPTVVTIKYDLLGNLVWTRPITSGNFVGPGGASTLSPLSLDNNQNIYIGCTRDTAGSLRDVMITKYNSSGTLLWNRIYASPSNDYIAAIDVDDSNNVYLSADMSASGNNSTIAIIKYGQTGNLRWFQTYLPPNSNTSSYTIEVDKNNNIYAGGLIRNAAGNFPDPLLVKYSQGFPNVRTYQKSNLNRIIPDPGNVEDTIRVTNDNPSFALTDVNVIIDTVIHPNVSDLELYLLHDGTTDTLIYQVGGTGDNFINTTLNDSAATPIANGTAPFTGSFRPSRPLSIFNSAEHSGDWVLRVYDRLTGNTGVLKAWKLQLQYLQSITEVRLTSNELPAGFSLSQNYPNPFNPTTTIRFAIPQQDLVSLRVYNLLGQEVGTLLNETRPAGSFEVTFDASRLASGVYIYRFTAGNQSAAKKLLFLK